MSTNNGEVEDMFGVGAYVLGLKAVFWLYALFLVLRVAGPAGTALNAASQAGPYSSDATEGVLTLLLIGVAIALFLGLFFATFVFVSVHSVDVLLTSSVTTGSDVPGFLTTANPGASGAVAIEPGLFFPSGLAQLFYLLPPALLVYAGYRERQVEDDLAAAVTKVVVGYGIMAAVTIVPVAWLFNEFVASMVADFLSSPLVDATIRLEYPSVIGAHLFVGLGYPLVFGGIGAFLAESSADARGHQRRAPPPNDAVGQQGHHPQGRQPAPPSQDQHAHRGSRQPGGGPPSQEESFGPAGQGQPGDHRAGGPHDPGGHTKQPPANHQQHPADPQQQPGSHQQRPPRGPRQSQRNERRQPPDEQPRGQREPPAHGQNGPPPGGGRDGPSGPAREDRADDRDGE